MDQKTVAKTVQENLCCGCGVCKAVCPQNCISWEKDHGIYVPRIEQTRCVNCGLCLSVCPGQGHSYVSAEDAKATITGSVLACCNAWSKDASLRHISASGGVISTMIRALLEAGMYDGVFCLDSYDYREQLKTRLFTLEQILSEGSSIPKSRYLPVSHENAAAYMKANRQARLIIIGSSCAIRGLQAVVKKLKLSTEQYLFIGLFCDQVFNYNVLSYFEDRYSPDAVLEEMHFKNKESGGWPGNMKLYPKGKSPIYVPMSERAKAKAYFMPERCLYCVDKLNCCADISLGDNYTGKDESKLGSNSVLIRTAAGAKAWEAVAQKLEIREVDLADIQKAQYLDGRLNNLYFGDLKSTRIKEKMDLNTGVPRENNAADYHRAWQERIRRLDVSRHYDKNPSLLDKQMLKDQKKASPIAVFVRRCVGYIRRKVKR